MPIKNKKPKSNLVRTFWQVTLKDKKKVEKIAHERGVSESQVVREFINK